MDSSINMTRNRFLKKAIVVLLIIVVGVPAFAMSDRLANREPLQAVAIEDTLDVFIKVDQEPRFEGGGIEKFRQWAIMRIKFPREAIDKGVEGGVTVQFVVEPDGLVGRLVPRSNTCISTKTGETDQSLINEAMRVVAESPKWEPGRQAGAAVPVLRYIQFEFKQ